MIAMGLMAVVTVYLIVLLLAALLPRGRKAKLICVGVVLSPIIYWCFDIPIGYVQFRIACEREGGLRILQPITKPATVVRLDATRGSTVYITDAAWRLKTYPWLDAFEAADPEFQGTAPPVYARFERTSKTDSAATNPQNAVGNPKVTRLDFVEQRWPLAVRPGTSTADYILSSADSSGPIRLSRQKYVLKTTDGRVIAKSSNLVYSWSDSQNTLLGQPIKVSRCPEGWHTGTSEDSLLKLTSAKRE